MFGDAYTEVVTMTKSEILSVYGGVTNTARILGLTKGTVSGWADDAVPLIRQVQAEKLSGGRLKFDWGQLITSEPLPPARSAA